MNRNLVNTRISTLIKLVLLGLWLSSCSEADESELQHKKKSKTKASTKIESKQKPFAEFGTFKSNQEAEAFLEAYKPKSNSNRVLIETKFGQIRVELFENTPLHRKNFLYLVDRKYFDGTWFHRVSPNHVIQAGNNDEYSLAKLRKVIGEYKIKPEALAQNYHAYGALAMARSYKNNPDKLSDPFEFYICMGPKFSEGQLKAMEEQYDMKLNADQWTLYREKGGSPHLDGQHTVFGRVISGMEVLEEISKVETDEGEWPIVNIPIQIRNELKP